MLVPLDVEVLAEARREAIEREMRKQHLIATLPQSPAPWQTAAGRGLIWAGVRLVNWGTGIAQHEYARGVEVHG